MKDRDLYDVLRHRQDELRGYPETRMDRLHHWWSTVRLGDIAFWIWSAVVAAYVVAVLGILVYITITANG